jgi:hypothetical protein
MNPIHVYLHAAGAHWREIGAELFGTIEGSGLYDAATSLSCVVVGGGQTRYLAPRGCPKWEVVEYGGYLDEYEYPTLRALWQRSKEDHKAHYLYLHTKGASSRPEGRLGAYSGKRFRDRWRKIMMHHLVTRWREAVTQLCHHDAVGSLYTGEPWPHFAGNFWWARGEYLATLPEPRPREWQHPRLWAEFWLGAGGARMAELYPLPSDLELAFLTDEYRGNQLRALGRRDADGRLGAGE